MASATTLCAALLGIALTTGCATPAAQPESAWVAREPAQTFGDRLIGNWQQQLADYVAGRGFGDPGVLSQLPALRSPAVMRPAQIIFCATDIDASAPERDGYDVCGVLLGTIEPAGAPNYLFAVGIIERSDYRPVAITDLRLVAMASRQGALAWKTGSADAQALDRYRSRFAPAAALHFPAAEDRFSTTPCGLRICAIELGSGAHWVLQF